MKRFRLLVVSVPLALMAAPILVACLSCCRPYEEFQTLDAPMPCCGEDCGSVSVAGVQDPALRASCSSDLAKIAVLQLPESLLTFEPHDSGAFPAFLTPSPPVLSRTLTSLRL